MADDNDPLRSVRPGDALNISAAGWNQIVETTRAYRSGRYPEKGGPDGKGTAFPNCEVLVQNSTGATLAAFQVVITSGFPVGTGGTPISFNDDSYEFNRRPAFKAIAPAAVTDTPLVTVEPIAAGEMGRAVLIGCVPAMLDAWDGTALRAGNFVQCVAGDVTKVRKATTGPARLLWFDPLVTGHETDLRRCVIVVGDAAPAGGGAVSGPISARLTDRDNTGAGNHYRFVEAYTNASGNVTDLPGGYDSGDPYGSTYAVENKGFRSNSLFTYNQPKLYQIYPNLGIPGGWQFNCGVESVWGEINSHRVNPTFGYAEYGFTELAYVGTSPAAPTGHIQFLATHPTGGFEDGTLIDADAVNTSALIGKRCRMY